MASNPIGLTTDTWYGPNDTVRSRLAIQMLTAAKERGYHLAVVDGGSHQDFLDQLTAAGIPYVRQEEKGMSNGRQQGYRLLHDNREVEVFARLEAEKVSMVRDGCVEMAARPILEGKADVVIPARCKAGIKSLPPFQAGSELASNAAFCAALRKAGYWTDKFNLDMFFGPRLFNRRAYPPFMQRWEFSADPPGTEWQQVIRPIGYSAALFFPVVRALAQGLRVVSVDVPYIHPPEQTMLENDDPEFDRKRLAQTNGILAELHELLAFLKDQPTGLRPVS